MDLSPLTKDDWLAYSGCESETPFIGQSGNTTMIVDGDVVELYGDSSSESRWTIKFPDKGMAMMFALETLGDEPDHIISLRAVKYAAISVCPSLSEWRDRGVDVVWFL